MSRKVARENTFKLIFQVSIQKEDKQEQLNIYIQNNEIEDAEVIKYIKDTFNGVIENEEEIIKLIKDNIKKEWKIERISKVDISILRLAIYELKYTELPYKVVINEAVELSKEYGDESSQSFVNGILASVVKECV